MSHAVDIKKLLKLNEFDEFTKNEGFVKQIFRYTGHGGPDENPRYQKVFFGIVFLLLSKVKIKIQK